MPNKKNSRSKNQKGGNRGKETCRKTSNDDRNQNKRDNNRDRNNSALNASSKQENNSSLRVKVQSQTDRSEITSKERKPVYEKSISQAQSQLCNKVNDLKYSSWQTSKEENTDEADEDDTAQNATPGMLKSPPVLKEPKKHDWHLFEKSLKLYHNYVALKNKTVHEETSTSPSSSSDDSDGYFERPCSLKKKSKSSTPKCRQRKRRQNYRTRKNNDAIPPNKYRTLSIFPSKEDIADELPFIRSNIVEGKYESCEHYLDVQFRLFREDYIKPLRDGIKEYKQKLEVHKERTFGNYEIDDFKERLKLSYIYENIKITNPELQNMFGLVHTLNFKPFPPSFIWKGNSRLQEGTLLCLSSDGYVNCFIFATVVSRDIDELKKGNIKVCFEDWKHDILYDFVGSGPYIMLEPCSGYFESYRHTLSVLKELDESNFPLQKYIVKAEREVDKPCYLDDKTLYDFSPILKEENYPDEEIPSWLKEVPILDKDWPSQKELGLDLTQYNVLKAALTKEFCIIQGPPGTGKTFMGLKIVKMLLHNSRMWYPENLKSECPILIVCYTNHALDQFLERILEFTDEVVRIGDQGESEILEPYRLKNLRTSVHLKEMHSDFSSRKRRLEEKQNYIKDQINTCNFVMEAASCLIFKPEVLKKYMEEDHYKSLLSRHCGNIDILLEKWLEVSHRDVEINLDPDVEYCAHKIDNCDKSMNIKEICSWIKWEYHDIKKQRSYGWNKHIDDKYKQLNERICELDMMHPEEITTVKNVWDLGISDKWRLYRYWIAKFIASIIDCVKHLQQEFIDISKQIKETRWEKDLAIVQTAKIVGITCTGTAKFHYLMESIAPQIVIVEEAAEVLEPHLITSLPKSVKHLILIGDHQQLRPLPAVYELVVQCQFDVSLFERMVKNEVEYWTLVSQHRMRPEIAELLKGTIYEELSSHEAVYHYEVISGIEKNVYFFSHISTESKSDTTYCNLFEAKMVVRLTRYFLLQGYEPSLITVLATYSGQIKMIKDEINNLMEENKNITCRLKDVKVTTVDNYQGEENDIIIVSFVRSNYERKIGFLKHPNRVCVALSRARKGLYCFGNFEFLVTESDLWKRIVDKLNQQDAIGSNLTLICQNHLYKTNIECSNDFKKVFDGGCAKVCGMIMKCSHICKRLCHCTDLEHKQYICEEKCTKQCENGHPCRKKCHEDCGKCVKMRFARLPQCGHRVPVPCYATDLSAYHCEESCDKMLSCGHACTKMCYETCEPCLRKVPKTLPCKHTVVTECYDHDVTCTEPCRHTLPCEHVCPNRCGEPCAEKCKRDVAIQLPCGHFATVPCEERHNEIKCKASCGVFLPCGHKCPGNCGKCHQGTKHIQCWLTCGKILDGRVTCKLRCGHKNKCNANFSKDIPINFGKSVKSPEHRYCDRHIVNKWKTDYNEEE